jgi:hypothetical protein
MELATPAVSAQPKGVLPVETVLRGKKRQFKRNKKYPNDNVQLSNVNLHQF